jgi:hypothetical protein
MVGQQSPVTGRRALRLLAAAVLVLVVVVGALVARDLGAGARTDDRVRLDLDSNCAFWHDLATLPLGANSSPTVLRIISDARAAYIHQGCAQRHGQLPAPDPRLSQYPPHQSAAPSPSRS